MVRRYSNTKLALKCLFTPSFFLWHGQLAHVLAFENAEISEETMELTAILSCPGFLGGDGGY